MGRKYRLEVSSTMYTDGVPDGGSLDYEETDHEFVALTAQKVLTKHLKKAMADANEELCNMGLSALTSSEKPKPKR